jgi:hypothetical protein
VKGEAEEKLSNQNELSSTVGGMMSTLKRLGTSFAKVQLWKQWNKLKDHSTANMEEEELKNHHLALKLLEKDFNFAEAHKEETVDEEDDE